MGMTTQSRNLGIRVHFGADKHALALGTLYFALFNGSPASGGLEPDATGGYARVARLNDSDLWGTYGATDTAVTNKGTSGAIIWPTASAIWSQNPLNHWAIFDNSAGGVLWYWGQLSTPATMTGAGDVIQLPPSALTIFQAA